MTNISRPMVMLRNQFRKQTKNTKKNLHLNYQALVILKWFPSCKWKFFGVHPVYFMLWRRRSFPFNFQNFKMASQNWVLAQWVNKEATLWSSRQGIFPGVLGLTCFCPLCINHWNWRYTLYVKRLWIVLKTFCNTYIYLHWNTEIMLKQNY